MKVQFAWLPLALALTAVAQPVSAADWGVHNGRVIDGGIKEFGSGAAVPVPVPMPIPEYKANWYFRLDAGLGIIQDPDVSEHGFVYGLDSGSGFSGGDSDFKPSWLSTDFNTSLTLGGGVGWYSGRGWRLDATIEKRSKDDVVAEAAEQYVTYEVGPPPCGGWCPKDLDNDPTTGVVHSTLLVQEQTKVDGTLWMLNAYYDLANRGRFTPYIGAGIGFSWNEISRSHTSGTFECSIEEVSPNYCAGGSYSAVPGTAATATDKSDTVSFAAAAMAGVSFDVSDMAKLDMGYRYLYIGGSHNTLVLNGVESTLDIGTQQIHQMRAGLRFDID